MSPYNRTRQPESMNSHGGGNPFRRFWSRLTAPARIGISIIVVIALVAGIVIATSKLVAKSDLNTTAYQSSLISVGDGDLPAPPFIGWTQSILEEPPARLATDESITNVNKEECEPGGERQSELHWLIMDHATRWSGTELFNAAYNSQIRVDASNANVEANGLAYDVVDRWLADCGFVSFDQGKSTVRVTYKPLEADMRVWDFDNGRAWVQTVSTTTPEGFQGSSSTITTIGNAPGVTLQSSITFRGRADDNAVNTMDLLWSSQSAKALAVQRSR